MTKRLLFLNGLAILTIPLHHAAAYGFQAMFYWGDLYRGIPPGPNYDLIGSLTYYILVIIRQLDTYSVPGFLFISGYFVAFMARGKESNVTFKMLAPRIKVLIYPFLIWTIIRYVLLRQWPESLEDVVNPYHFIPLLIQFYLLSPWLVPIARKNWKLLLLIAAAVHFGVQGLRYMNNLGVTFPGLDFLLRLMPRWIVIGQQPFWFPFGLAFGLHSKQFAEWFTKHKWKWVVLTVVFGVLAVAEYQFADYLNGEEWIGPAPEGLSRNFYILFFLLTFLTFDVVSNTFTKTISNIGSQSLGIYMANIPTIYVVSVLMVRIVPEVLGIQIIYQTVLILCGLLIPLFMMWFVRKIPTLRPSYRYIFG